MMIKKSPKVAFMPRFEDFGETFPLIEIAKKYMELGGQIIFIGYKGEYEVLAKDLGCKVIELKQNITKKIAQKRRNSYKKYHYKSMSQEWLYSRLFNKESEKFFIDKIEQEINIFKDEEVKLVVAALNFTPLISTAVANTPLIVLISE